MVKMLKLATENIFKTKEKETTSSKNLQFYEKTQRKF
jgi:hypothetical protein